MKYVSTTVKLSKEEMDECKKILATNLKMLRSSLFLSQTELGKRAGISRMRLSSIECGKYNMTWDQFTSLLLIFIINRRSNIVIQSKDMFPTKLYQFLQCKNDFEAVDKCFY